MMTTEPRAAQCCCCNARATLIAWECFCVFYQAIGAIYSILEIFDRMYQKSYTYLWLYKVWGFVQLILNILFLYGAVKRQSRILMAGFIYETFQAVLIGILWLLVIIIPSVFTDVFTDLFNTSTSSAIASGQGSSMSSQQQQQEVMEAAGTDFFISMLVTSMGIALIIMLAIQSMICYLYFVVYQEAKRFQNNQVVVQPAGVVMQQCNYSNYPQLYIVQLPNSHFNLPNSHFNLPN